MQDKNMKNLKKKCSDRSMEVKLPVTTNRPTDRKTDKGFTSNNFDLCIMKLPEFASLLKIIWPKYFKHGFVFGLEVDPGRRKFSN